MKFRQYRWNLSGSEDLLCFRSVKSLSHQRGQIWVQVWGHIGKWSRLHVATCVPVHIERPPTQLTSSETTRSHIKSTLWWWVFSLFNHSATRLPLKTCSFYSRVKKLVLICETWSCVTPRFHGLLAVTPSSTRPESFQKRSIAPPGWVDSPRLSLFHHLSLIFVLLCGWVGYVVKLNMFFVCFKKWNQSLYRLFYFEKSPDARCTSCVRFSCLKTD